MHRPCQTHRPHLDLPLRFFAGDVEHALTCAHCHGHLQHQRGLADAGVAADQHDGAGHDSPAEHARELPDRNRDPVPFVAADLTDGARCGAPGQPA
jgi:hypothetical protein